MLLEKNSLTMATSRRIRGTERSFMNNNPIVLFIKLLKKFQFIEHAKSVDTMTTPNANADILVIHDITDDLIQLETEDSFDFPFQGSEEEFKQEIEQIRCLLKASPQTDPMLLPPFAESAAPSHKIHSSNFVFGHNPQRVRQIQEENQRLVKRLQQVAEAPSKLPTTAEEHDRHMANSVASRLTRQRKHDNQISRENLFVYQRLQATKADKDVDRTCLQTKYRLSRQYASHITMKRQAPPPPPPGVSHAAKQPWNNRWHVSSIA